MFPRKAFGLVFAFIFFFQLTAQANFSDDRQVPSPSGDIYVQDFANILNENEKAELRSIGMNIEDQTSNQIAVLTVESIGDTTIEEYANRAYRKYGLGTKENDNGVLLILAMKDKKVRIEVGYGLEGIIPDGKAGRILDANAIPYLREGQPNLAVINTYKALAEEASGEASNDAASQSEKESSTPPWLLIIIIVGLIFLDMKFFGGTLTYALLTIFSRGGGGGGGPRGGGGGSSGGGGASRGW